MSDLSQPERGDTCMADLPKLLTAKEAAQRLRISPRTFRNFVRLGEIRYVLISPRRKLFTEDDLAEFVRSRVVVSKSASRQTRRQRSKPPVYDFMARRAERKKARKRK